MRSIEYYCKQACANHPWPQIIHPIMILLLLPGMHVSIPTTSKNHPQHHPQHPAFSSAPPYQHLCTSAHWHLLCTTSDLCTSAHTLLHLHNHLSVEPQHLLSTSAPPTQHLCTCTSAPQTCTLAPWRLCTLAAALHNLCTSAPLLHLCTYKITCTLTSAEPPHAPLLNLSTYSNPQHLCTCTITCTCTCTCTCTITSAETWHLLYTCTSSEPQHLCPPLHPHNHLC